VAYERVAAVDDLWPGDMMGAVAGGTKVLLVRTNEGVLAYEDRCAHTCSAHHWQYDVRTGFGINPESVRLKPLSAVVKDGAIFVDVAREDGR
jgi:toluene monooxygenase system ferredoxin subunit